MLNYVDLVEIKTLFKNNGHFISCLIMDGICGWFDGEIIQPNHHKDSQIKKKKTVVHLNPREPSKFCHL